VQHFLFNKLNTSAPPQQYIKMEEKNITTTNAAIPNHKTILKDPEVPVISVSGGGNLMPWYCGAIKAVLEVRGKEPTVFAAFSSGALASAICLCELNIEHAIKRFVELMDKENVSKRMFGIAFIWGRMVRSWLEEILPENAAEMCEGSLVVHVLECRGIRKKGFVMRRVSNFPSRSVLIETLLASCHIPFLLDGRPWTTLTTTEGDLPHGTYKAIDCVVLYIFNMRRSKKAKNKYRISTESERKADMTISHAFDESLKNGPGYRDYMNFEQGKEIGNKGYEHTLARLETPKFSYLSSWDPMRQIGGFDAIAETSLEV